MCVCLIFDSRSGKIKTKITGSKWFERKEDIKQMRLPQIINSLLETDMYKFSMGQTIFHQFTSYKTTWTFKCRNKDVHFTDEMVEEIKEQVQAFCQLRFTEEELEYLDNITWIKGTYVDFLRLWQPRYEEFTITTDAPPLGFENDESELYKINQMITDAHPDLLIGCLGCPKQEKWIYENYMKYDATVSVCAGATVDFLAGNIKRAPRWMSDHGLEWFYRFLQEPKRMFKRYFVDDVKILGLIRKYK